MIARVPLPFIPQLLKGMHPTLAVGLVLISWLNSTAANAQIVPANDGTGTIATPTGNQFDITGGQTSADGSNLFHSFTQFGLDQSQVANFLSNPAIQNILARVDGNNPSIINGLLQVTGGNSNLFLINPSGILFGNSASLNVPASFTATTAPSIGFNNNWLTATSTNYTALNGNPNALAFPFQTAGAIVNTGNLSVSSGNLTLIGGTILSPGPLAASNGNITVATVPGQNLTRLSQPDRLLSLEIRPLDSSLSASGAPSVATLPQLLTGGSGTSATGLTRNQNGQVELTGSGLQVANGDVVAKNITAQTATLSASQNLTLFESQLQTIGNLNLLADNTVRVRDSVANPVLVQAQGNLFIQGNQGIDILTLNHLVQTPFVSGGNLTLVSDGIISGDAHFASRGSFALRNLAGGSGTFVSLYDPIISANGDVDFGAYTGISLKVEAIGSITGRNISITGPDTITVLDPDFPTLSGRSSLILRAGVSSLANPANSFPFTLGATGFTLLGAPSVPASVTVGDINISPFLSTDPLNAVTIAAPGNITTGIINASVNINSDVTGGNVNLSAGGNIVTGAIDTSTTSNFPADLNRAGNVTLATNTGNITFASINTSASSAILNGRGGNVQLLAPNGTVRGVGFVSLSPTDTILTRGDDLATGTVEISHDGGPFNRPFVVGDATSNGIAGAITTATTVIAPTTPFALVGPTPQGNAIFVFNNTAPTISASPTLPATPSGQPIIFTSSDLAPIVVDANKDNTVITITIPVGATLTIDGIPINGKTVQILPNPPVAQTFEYTPPAGTIGTFPALTLTATDGVSTSLPIAVEGTITAAVPIPPPVEPTPVDPNPPPENPPEDLNPIVELAPEVLDPDIDDAFEGESADADNDPTSVNQGILDTDPFVSEADESVSSSFEEYLELDTVVPKELPDVRGDLADVEKNTGVKPALVYALFVPSDLTPADAKGKHSAQDSDQLELFIVTAKGNPVRKRVPGATRGNVVQLAHEFQRQVSDRKKVRTTSYLTSAQQLYQWLIAPMEAEFKLQKIQNLVFITDAGLRSLPFAALHDGTGFLVERFSVGLMPSISLTDTSYGDIKKSELLAMGASHFTQSDQAPLPSVPLEMSAVSNLWKGEVFLNDRFTLKNLQSQRNQRPYGIIHLATHAEFQSGPRQNSYIQLSDTKLELDQIRQLGWNHPPVELLVLSACRTALGDKDAELGFAGLAVKSGVKTAMASLWYVSDDGTLDLMTKFYQRLKTAPIKAEALRQAQIQMLKGDASATATSQKFAHPYYWSSFTMIGSPW